LKLRDSLRFGGGGERLAMKGPRTDIRVSSMAKAEM